MAKATKQERADAVEYLRKAIEGATRESSGRVKVYAAVTTVARSGMSRTIEFYVIDHETRDLLRITRDIATACDYAMNENGLRVGGCGMDMRFAVLDSVARAIGMSSGNDFYIAAIA